jgi:antirestriction protein ArdC
VANQLQIRTELAGKVLEALKKGSPPWRSKYNRGIPTNPQTGRKFTGINPLILDAVADKHRFRSKYWATYHQWHILSIQVPKRPPKATEFGIHIVNWNPFTKVVDKGNLISLERFHLLQTYTVFNADQCFGQTCGHYLILKENTESPDYLYAEQIVENTKANFSKGKKPKYDRIKDKILFPGRGHFVNDAQYWATKFHELSHWAERRTGWVGPEDQSELIAEIATGYLESELNLPHDTDAANHDVWMPVWIKSIEENPKYLFDAAAQAARTVDYVLGFTKIQEREDIS